VKKKSLIRRIQSSFACTRCNQCCRRPGFVYVKMREIDRMASFLKLQRSDFLERYCELDEGRHVLKSLPDDACIFLTDEGCSVNPAKPGQCRSFPKAWRDPDSFDYCEGIKALKQ